jgi:hypothetical protein
MESAQERKWVGPYLITSSGPSEDTRRLSFARSFLAFWLLSSEPSVSY